MKSRNASLLVIVLSLAMSPAAMANTWYVDGANGDFGNNCKTKATACPTIGRAIALAASGDTIQIAAATYPESLTIPFNLTMHGANEATTIVEGSTNAGVFTVGGSVSLTLSNLTIKNGVSLSSGGGVNNSGTLTVAKSNFYTNTALSGGAILNTGTATISNSNFTGNSPIFFGHSAGCGAIDNSGTMTITTSTFYSNFANNNFTSGGAICNSGTLTIARTTFSTNSSQGNNGGDGGAIYNSAGTLSVINSTFSQNSATTSGGAIYNQGGTVKIRNSTFAINPENIGGGGALSNAGGLILIQNSIIANTGNGGNCSGTITSDGYNLSTDTSCNFSGPGDLTGANPLLGALASNGGPTQTMALQSGSPAIDAGNPAGCLNFAGNLLTTDQRGAPRPDNGETGCDMGAFERQVP